MSIGNNALSNAAQVETLADGLSQCADALHARVMRALRKRVHTGKPTRLDQGISQVAAQALFDTEVALRQHANSLYMDAARFAISGLDASQNSVLEPIEAAQNTIRKLVFLRDLIDTCTDLLALAGAAVSGKPERIVAALKKMQKYGTAQPAEQNEVY